MPRWSDILLGFLLALIGWLTPVSAISPAFVPEEVSQIVAPNSQATAAIRDQLTAYRPNGPPSSQIQQSLNPGVHRGIWVVVFDGDVPSAVVIQYAYAGGDPVNRWDPSGLDWYEITRKEGEKDDGTRYWFDNTESEITVDDIKYRRIGENLEQSLKISMRAGHKGWPIGKEAMKTRQQMWTFIKENFLHGENLFNLRLKASLQDSKNITIFAGVSRSLTDEALIKWQKYHDDLFASAKIKKGKWQTPHLAEFLSRVEYGRKTASDNTFNPDVETTPMIAAARDGVSLLEDKTDLSNAKVKNDGDYGPYFDVGWQKRTWFDQTPKWLWSSNYLVRKNNVNAGDDKNKIESMSLPPLKAKISGNGRIDLWMHYNNQDYSYGTTLGHVQLNIEHSKNGKPFIKATPIDYPMIPPPIIPGATAYPIFNVQDPLQNSYKGWLYEEK